MGDDGIATRGAGGVRANACVRPMRGLLVVMMASFLKTDVGNTLADVDNTIDTMLRTT